MDTRDKLKELNMTEDEIQRLTKAMKDDKFKELLHDYAREISDPENKRRYEEEITLMEQQRGNNIDFIHPTPFRALRTSVDGKRKCYVNICSNAKVAKPAWTSGTSADGRRGQSWSLPHSLHPGRPNADAKGKTFTIYDVVFHPDTLHMASRNPRFMEMVESTAMQGIQDSFKVTLDTKNVRTMKTKYKGMPQPCVIRNPIPGFQARDPAEDLFPFKYPDDEPAPVAKTPAKEHKPTSLQTNREANLGGAKEPTRPHYTIKYRSFIDLQDFRFARDSATTPRPKEIVVTLELPLLSSAADANLDVKQKSLLLESERPAYRLQLDLPYEVDQEKGRATFNKQRGQLTVTLPVLPSKEAAQFSRALHGGEGWQEGKGGGEGEGGDTCQEQADGGGGGHEVEEQVRNLQEGAQRREENLSSGNKGEEEQEQEQERVEEEAEGHKTQIGEQPGEEEAEGQRCDQIHQHAVEDEDEGPTNDQTQSEKAEGHNQINEEIEEEEAKGLMSSNIDEGIVGEKAEDQIHEHVEEDEGPQNDQIHEQSEDEEAEGQKCYQLHQHVTEDLKSNDDLVVEKEVEDHTSDGRTPKKAEMSKEQRQERQEHAEEVNMQLSDEDEERSQLHTSGGNELVTVEESLDLMVDSPAGGGGDLNPGGGSEVEDTNTQEHAKVEAGPLVGRTGEESLSAEGTRESEDGERLDEDDLPAARSVHHPEAPQQLGEQLGEQPPLVELREVDRDGNVTVINDHCTSAGFVFQNSLIEELD